MITRIIRMQVYDIYNFCQDTDCMGERYFHVSGVELCKKRYAVYSLLRTLIHVIHHIPLGCDDLICKETPVTAERFKTEQVIENICELPPGNILRP